MWLKSIETIQSVCLSLVLLASTITTVKLTTPIMDSSLYIVETICWCRFDEETQNSKNPAQKSKDMMNRTQNTRVKVTIREFRELTRPKVKLMVALPRAFRAGYSS